MRALLRWTTFPVLFFGGTGATIVLLERGVDPELLLALVPTVAAALVFGLERALPYRREWNRLHGDLLTDVLHNAVSMVLVPRLFDLAALVALERASTALRGLLGSPWPSGWPLALQLALALVIAELFAYALHRALHEVPVLFRLHATHHSTPRLYFLNAGRIHPLEALAVVALFTGPLALLGAPSEVIALALVATSIHGSLQHSNVDLSLGWLNWIFAGAELHRWHHVRPTAIANHNYGQTLILWDLVFRTRHLPRDEEPSADIGLENLPRFPTRYLGQLLSPLRWEDILASSRESVADRERELVGRPDRER